MVLENFKKTLWKLSKQFDAMTSYIQELTSMLEAYRQQVKEAWPLPLTSLAILFS